MDINTEIERNREESEGERLKGESSVQKNEIMRHPLHPHHQLNFVGADTRIRCDACLNTIQGNRYHCDSCDFDLHPACAVSFSDDMVKTNFQTSAHEHPLNVVQGSDYACELCKDESEMKDRYYCRECNKSFHLICATHPVRLSSFLHPEHELELKTRRNFETCSVCHHSRELNSMVYGRFYGCMACKFYVHPDCAQKDQYRKHPSHNNDHILVFRKCPRNRVAVCKICSYKCKYWSYFCSICEGIYFHEECLSGGISKQEEYEEDMKRFKFGMKIFSMLDGVGDGN